MTKDAELDRRHIDWRLGWIDRRRHELREQLADLYRQECEVLGLKSTVSYGETAPGGDDGQGQS